MRTNIFTSSAIAAAVVAAAALSSAGSATAMPMAKSPAFAKAAANVETVQWRGRWWLARRRLAWAGTVYRRTCRGRYRRQCVGVPRLLRIRLRPRLLSAPGYYPPGYAYGGDEMYEGEGGGDAQAYCMQRFRSYNPRLGTYLGNDGARHPCP